MKFLILTLVLSFTFNVTAMEVWVTTPQPVSPEKLHVYIKNLPPELKDAEIHSFMEEQLRNPMSVNSKEKIEKMMSQAQDEELNRNYGLAIKLNEQVLTEIEKYPNILGLQSITFSIFLKLAQLYNLIQDSEKSKNFFQKAYAWNSKAELHEEVYPPSVIKKYKKLFPHSEFTEVKIKAPAYSMVFFDGKKVVSPSVKVLTGKHQIAVLIPGSLWQIENLRFKNASKKPLVFEFKSASVVSGSCENPELKHLKLPQQTRLLVVFEKDNCNRVFDGETWYSIDGLKVNGGGALPSASLIAQMNASESESWITKVTKSPWFWVGFSVVAVGSILVAHNQPTQVTPTINHGMN